MQSAHDPTKVLICRSASRVTLVGGEPAKGNKRKVLNVPLPSEPEYLTASTAPPMMAKEVGRASPRVKMA